MSRNWAGLVVIGALAACGGDGDDGVGSGDLPSWRSGERVRAVLAGSIDGFSTRVGWRDLELDLDCRSGSIAPFCGAVDADTELELYADAGCSRPALVIHESPHQGYAALRRPGEEPRAFRLVAMLFDFFVADSSGCIPGSGIEAHAALELADGELARWRPAAIEGVDAYETDDGALDLITVSGGDRRTDDATTRLRTIYIDDGRVRAAVGIHDSERVTGCSIVATTGDVHRCVPNGLGFTWSMYRDAACGGTPVDVSPLRGARLQRDAGVVSAVEEHTTLDPGPFYVSDGSGGCVASRLEEHYTGGPVPLESYAVVTLTVE